MGGEGLARAGRETAQTRVAPQPQLALCRRHGHGQIAEVRHVLGAGHTVLWEACAIGLRGEPRVPPRAGPRGARIDLRVAPGLLIADESAVSRRGPVHGWFVAGVPVALIAGEKLHVHSGVAGGNDVRPLARRPVLIVPDGQEHLVVRQFRPKAVGIDAAEVTDVVAVLLQEAHKRVLIGEVEVAPGVVSPSHHGPVVADLVGVVADLVGAAGGAALVEVRAAIGVVGLPGGVGGLEEHRRMARIVAHDERDVALAAGIVAVQEGEVDTGYRGARHAPRRGDRPIAAVVQPGRRIGDALGLTLRERCRRGDGGDLPSAESLVVTRAVNGDRIRLGIGVDLEVDRGADVDADVGGESLDRRVTGSIDIPYRRIGARFAVLANDRVRSDATGRCCLGGLRIDGDQGRCQQYEGRYEGRNHRRAATRDVAKRMRDSGKSHMEMIARAFTIRKAPGRHL